MKTLVAGAGRRIYQASHRSPSLLPGAQPHELSNLPVPFRVQRLDRRLTPDTHPTEHGRLYWSSARDKLNTAYIHGSLMIAGLLGAIGES